jgi:hypothetical protein
MITTSDSNWLNGNSLNRTPKEFLIFLLGEKSYYANILL